MLTEKSWKVLQSIKGKFSFILIGGWAAYLWTRGPKSKDIDVIVDFPTLEKLKAEHELRKNDHLKKYEIKIEGIDIHIYVPHYSKLPIQDFETSTIEGFKVVRPEVLLILKQAAHLERKHSEKGLKDELDIISLLLKTGIDFGKYKQILKENGLKGYVESLKKIVKSGQHDFGMSPRQLKLKKQELMEKLT